MPETDSIVYRKDMIPGDREAIGRLVRATGFFSEEEAAIAEELVDERMAKGEASGYFFLFAEEGGRLLGYTCFGPIPGSVHSYDLYWIAVDPGAQGRDPVRGQGGAVRGDGLCRGGRTIREEFHVRVAVGLACRLDVVGLAEDPAVVRR